MEGGGLSLTKMNRGGSFCMAATMMFICAGLFAASYVALFRSNETIELLSQSNWAGPLFLAFGNSSSPKVAANTELLTNFTEDEILNLRNNLKSVAFRNNTVILTTLNKAWAENGSMIDLFLESFNMGYETKHLLDHLLIVTLDQAAHDRCLTVHPHCFSLQTDGVDFSGGEKLFMTADYLKMMWRRIQFLSLVLELGYSFVFSDADIMWFRDPFQHFLTSSDFEIACDFFNGNPTALTNMPNGGFVHATSNPTTIELYRLWYKSRENYPNHHDQDVFNDIKFSKEFTSLKLKVTFLDTQFFGGFCQVSKDFEKVCTMHANCCTKLDRKLKDLRLVLDDWKRFKAMPSKSKQAERMFWRAPRECLHSFHHRG